MFELYLLRGSRWIPYFINDNLDKIDDALQTLLEREPGGHVQYLENGKVLAFLTLNEHQYNWWKENFYQMENILYRRLINRNSKFSEYD